MSSAADRPPRELGTGWSARVDHWQLGTIRLEFGRLPAVMGIVNVTPDSFSDGGQFADPSHAVEHALRLQDEGADILDIGGESTRPFAQRVDVEEELRRVMPVVESLAARSAVPISIDTSKARVAREAIAAGAQVINDVTGLEGDVEMVEVARRAGAGVCAMHMQGTPQTMQIDPRYGDVTTQVLEYLAQRRDALLAAGIDSSRICLDVGIGFGKSHEHNLQLLAQIARFHQLGTPLLVGHSRKGFIGKVIGDADADRTAGGLAVTLHLARCGVQVVRVHQVRETRQALAMWDALGAVDGRWGLP